MTVKLFNNKFVRHDLSEFYPDRKYHYILCDNITEDIYNTLKNKIIQNGFEKIMVMYIDDDKKPIIDDESKFNKSKLTDRIVVLYRQQISYKIIGIPFDSTLSSGLDDTSGPVSNKSSENIEHIRPTILLITNREHPYMIHNRKKMIEEGYNVITINISTSTSTSTSTLKTHITDTIVDDKYINSQKYTDIIIDFIEYNDIISIEMLNKYIKMMNKYTNACIFIKNKFVDSTIAALDKEKIQHSSPEQMVGDFSRIVIKFQEL